MLVLSRKRDEEIVVIVGPNPEDVITIKVVEIRGDKCRIGLDADRRFPVHRKEVFSAILRNGDPLFGRFRPANPDIDNATTAPS